MLTIILLAAGASHRMGSNKLLLPFKGQTILETTLGQLEAAGVGDIIVVTGHEASRLQPLLQGRPCRVVLNPNYKNGMTTSIQTGIAGAISDTTGFMICLADMPLVTAVEYQRLAKTFAQQILHDPATIIQPQYQGRRGNPVLFSAGYRDELLALDFPDGAKPVVRANPHHLSMVDMSTDSVLLDADTPEAYQLLLERLNADSI